MFKTAFGARSTADDVLQGLDLRTKTILVTGCNGGIGFETMRALAANGAHVIGLARTSSAARDACARVEGATTPITCDLGDISSVLAAAKAVRAIGKPVDTIVANAGIMCPETLNVRYGVELQFMVNHIGHFLLIDRLIDFVPEHTGRIVITSSSASIDQAPKEGIMFDNLDGHQFYKPFLFYGQSKLANALFAKELARRLKGSGIAVNSLHPGAVGGTALQRSLGFPFKLILSIASRFMKSIPQGAATQVLLAASPLVEGITGEYWSDCNIAEGSKHLAHQGMAKGLWTVSEEIISAQLEASS